MSDKTKKYDFSMFDEQPIAVTETKSDTATSPEGLDLSMFDEQPATTKDRVRAYLEAKRNAPRAGGGPLTEEAPAFKASELPGLWQSTKNIARAGLQGATMGLSDELRGALAHPIGATKATAALFTGHPATNPAAQAYYRTRDIERQALANMPAYDRLIGELAGSTLPIMASGGLSSLGRGGKVAAAMLNPNIEKANLLTQAAKMAGSGTLWGGAYGLGTSQASNIPGMSKDVGEGALFGSAMGGLAVPATAGMGRMTLGAARLGNKIMRTNWARKVATTLGKASPEAWDIMVPATKALKLGEESPAALAGEAWQKGAESIKRHEEWNPRIRKYLEELQQREKQVVGEEAAAKEQLRLQKQQYSEERQIVNTRLAAAEKEINQNIKDLTKERTIENAKKAQQTISDLENQINTLTQDMEQQVANAQPIPLQKLFPEIDTESIKAQLRTKLIAGDPRRLEVMRYDPQQGNAMENALDNMAIGIKRALQTAKTPEEGVNPLQLLKLKRAWTNHAENLYNAHMAGQFTNQMSRNEERIYAAGAQFINDLLSDTIPEYAEQSRLINMQIQGKNKLKALFGKDEQAALSKVKPGRLLSPESEALISESNIDMRLPAEQLEQKQKILDIKQGLKEKRIPTDVELANQQIRDSLHSLSNQQAKVATAEQKAQAAKQAVEEIKQLTDQLGAWFPDAQGKERVSALFKLLYEDPENMKVRRAAQLIGEKLGINLLENLDKVRAYAHFFNTEASLFLQSVAGAVTATLAPGTSGAAYLAGKGAAQAIGGGSGLISRGARKVALSPTLDLLGTTRRSVFDILSSLSTKLNEASKTSKIHALFKALNKSGYGPVKHYLDMESNAQYRKEYEQQVKEEE